MVNKQLEYQMQRKQENPTQHEGGNLDKLEQISTPENDVNHQKDAPQPVNAAVEVPPGSSKLPARCLSSSPGMRDTFSLTIFNT